jgi:hypothetical protein
VKIRMITTRYQFALRAISLRSSGLFVASVSMSGLVLTLVAVLAGALSAWRFGADLGWTEHFFIAGGLFSHCQLWFAVAIGGQTLAFILNRWAANQNIDLLVLAP